MATKRTKAACLTAAAAVTAFLCQLACNGTPASPEVEFIGPGIQSGTAPAGTSNSAGAAGPASVGTTTSNVQQFTILDGINVQKRADCKRNQPGWFLPDGYDITVRIEKNLEHEYRMVSNVFWAPEPNCVPTDDQPGRGSSWEQDGKFLKASFNPEKDCGRYQWDLKAINVTTGEELNVFYAVLNTGNERCTPPPPPPGCTGPNCNPDPPCQGEECDETPGCDDGELSDPETGECLPICNLGNETSNLRGFGFTESQSCLCPDGSRPDPESGCEEEPPCQGEECNPEPPCEGEDCDPPCEGEECDEEPPCEDCDEEPGCEAPEEQNFSLNNPIGNPTAECSYFGSYSPEGEGSPAFYVTKCGLFYEVTHGPWSEEQCSNGQDVSHSTPCYCSVND